ncbi:MAG: HDOD domain-containing protein [Proteobacteria bacterium]|nr:HDOD domain-containing protein [Pseudomonadota bacterium]
MSDEPVVAQRIDTGRIIKEIDSLPTLPLVALQIGEVIHNKNVSVPQVVAILRSDPSTSAKLLRLVNSPYFGIPGGVADLARAIPFIGFNTLYQLVLSISVLETLHTKNGVFDPKSLWLHSLTVATAARELATELKLGDPGSCFTAGLLHDMGKIALAKIDHEGLTMALATMRAEHIPMHEAEKRHGLTPHERIGSRLAKQWKFPATLSTPIEQHHLIQKQEVRERMPANLRAITEIVFAADFVSHDCVATFGGDPDLEDGDSARPDLFERNGFTARQLTALRDRTKVELERSKVFLQLLESTTPPAKPAVAV